MKFFVGIGVGLVLGTQLGILAACINTIKKAKQSEE